MRRVVTSALRGQQGLDGAAVLAWATALWREPVFERPSSSTCAGSVARWRAIDDWNPSA